MAFYLSSTELNTSFYSCRPAIWNISLVVFAVLLLSTDMGILYILSVQQSLLFSRNICALSSFFIIIIFITNVLQHLVGPSFSYFHCNRSSQNCDVSTFNGTVISEMVEYRSIQSLSLLGSHRYLSELYRFRCTQVTLKVGN